MGEPDRGGVVKLRLSKKVREQEFLKALDGGWTLSSGTA